MAENKNQEFENVKDIETKEWLESLEYILQAYGPERVKELLHDLDTYAHESGVELPFTANTPYINTIPRSQQPHFPVVEKSSAELKA